MYVSYRTSFEEAPYDAVDPYEGGPAAGELTCPPGWAPMYKRGPGWKRPEWDLKIAPQPEIRTGMQAAGFFSTWSAMRACLFKTFSLTPGRAFRASGWGMGVASGIGAGMQLVAAPDGSQDWEVDWLAGRDEWWSNYDRKAYNRVWHKFEITGTVGPGGLLTVFLVGNTDSASIEHHGTHWDDFRLEVEDDQPDSGIEIDYERIASLTAERVLALQAIDRLDLVSRLLEMLQSSD